MKIKSIEVSKVQQNENSRVMYKEVDLSELMRSIKKDGLLQPIGVRALSGGEYDCIWGNRRLMAVKKLGWKEIPAHIVEVESDIDREVLNLIENLKRQNTSVAEDGRIFALLKDRGLSEAEIAVRLDIPEQRIKTALEVISVVPEEFRKKIVYRTAGQKRKLKDRIAASTALQILNIRRSEKLNRAATRDLFRYAAEKQPSSTTINKIAPMLRRGVSLQEAIERTAEYEEVSVKVMIKSSNIEKLESKYKKQMSHILFDFLSQHDEFKIMKPEKGKFILRKANNELQESKDSA